MPHPVGFAERGTGVEQQRHGQRALVKRRQKRARQPGGAEQHQRAQHGGAQAQRAPAGKAPIQRARHQALELAHQPAVGVLARRQGGQQPVAQHWRHRQRHQQAGQNRGDVRHAQRGEQPAFDAGQGKQRHKHQHHHQGGHHHAGAHLVAGGDNHPQDVRRRAFGRQRLQPAQHVFHVHQRVVHQLANGDGQPAQGHDIDRLVQSVKHRQGDGQRQRDGGQRDQRGAHIEQKQKQNQRHHDGAVAQRFGHIGHRGLNKVRLAERHLRRLHPGRQALAQAGQRGFDVGGEPGGIRLRLFLHADHHGGLAVVAGVAALGGGGKFDLRQLTQQHRLAIALGHRQVFQVGQRQGLANMANQVFAGVLR